MSVMGHKADWCDGQATRPRQRKQRLSLRGISCRLAEVTCRGTRLLEGEVVISVLPSIVRLLPAPASQYIRRTLLSRTS